jgi:hypothetical protein
MPLSLYSKDSTDDLLDAKLDLAGGTLTGGLTLSATGIIFSDATTLTTAPAGSTLAADQLTVGVVAVNPTAGPTTAGDVLQYDGAALIWTPGGGGGSFLPLAGGTMTGAIVFDGTSGQYISKGNFDSGRGGNYGISLVCSIGYEFNWQAGWLTTTEQNSVTPRPLYLDSLAGTTLRAWDSATSTGTEISHTGLNIGNTTEYFINAAPDLLKVFESTNDLGVSIAHDSIAIQHIDTPDRTSYFTNEYIGFEDLSGSPHSAYIEHDVITVQDASDNTQMRSTGITLSAGGSLTFGDATTQTTAGIGDAPSDGSTYGRKDGAWEAVAGGTVAADQITAGVVTANPSTGPATNYESLYYYLVSGTTPSLLWSTGVSARQITNGYASGISATPTDGQYLKYTNSPFPTLEWTDLPTPPPTVKTVNNIDVSSADYYLQLSDANNIVNVSAGDGSYSGKFVYITAEATVNFPIGTEILFTVTSAGSNNYVYADSGVTIIQASNSLNYGLMRTAVKLGSDLWMVSSSI